MNRQDLDLIKSTVDVRALLESYGAKITLDQEEGLRCNCIVHGGDNPTSLSYSRKAGQFFCFGECGFKGDVFNLVQVMDGCSFAESIKRVSEFSSYKSNGMCAREAKTEDPWIATLEKAYTPEGRNESLYSPLVERSLKHRPNPYVSAGKFDQETIDYFEIGYCNFNDAFMGRAIITIRDEFGELVGFSGRDMRNAETTNKYRIKKGFKKGYVLYNLDRAKHFISRKSPLIICEGFGQVWRLHEAGYDNAVAIMGKTVTEEQLALMLRYTTSVILALDFDESGVEGTKKLIDLLDDRVDVQVVTSRFGEKIDLGDMSVDNVEECYDSRVPAYLWVNKVYNKRESKER